MVLLATAATKAPENAPIQEVMKQRSTALLFMAMAVLVAPLVEETIFRGYLYGVTKRFTDRWFASIFISFVFACVHQHLGSTAPLFVLAMGFSVAYELTGSLLVPMIMHAMFNGTNLILFSLALKS